MESEQMNKRYERRRRFLEGSGYHVLAQIRGDNAGLLYASYETPPRFFWDEPVVLRSNRPAWKTIEDDTLYVLHQCRQAYDPVRGTFSPAEYEDVYPLVWKASMFFARYDCKSLLITLRTAPPWEWEWTLEWQDTGGLLRALTLQQWQELLSHPLAECRVIAQRLYARVKAAPDSLPALKSVLSSPDTLNSRHRQSV